MNKEKYKEFCKNEKNIPIFSQYWWLDALCDEWNVVLIEKNNEIVASLPYHIQKNNNLIQLGQPILTQKLGPYLKFPDTIKYITKLKWEKRLMSELIENLPEYDIFSQNFDFSITNWLPFYWKGFSQYTRYTYRIKYPNTIENIWGECDQKTRNDIRKAEKILYIKSGISLKNFYDLNIQTFERQKRKIPYSFEYILKLDNICKEKNCRQILLAVDDKDNIHGTVYLIWDNTTLYYLMGGMNNNFVGSNSIKFLLWEAIKISMNNKLNFDFEGSMKPNLEKVFSSFSAIQIPYFHIEKKYQE